MPYYVELDQMRVVHRSRLRAGAGRQEWIHSGTAMLCELNDGQLISPDQLTALRKRSVSDYRAAAPPTSRTIADAAAPIEALTGGVARPAASIPTMPNQLRIEAVRLYELARTVSLVFGILGVIGVIGGIFIATQQTTVRDGLLSTTEHRDLGIGVAIAVGSAAQAAFALVITNTAALFAGYVAHRLQPSPPPTADSS